MTRFDSFTAHKAGYLKGLFIRTLRKTFAFCMLFLACYGVVIAVSVIVKFFWSSIPEVGLSIGALILVMMICERLRKVIEGLSRKIFRDKNKNYSQKIQELAEQLAFEHHSDRGAEVMMDYLVREMDLQWAGVYLKSAEEGDFTLIASHGAVRFETLKSRGPLLDLLRIILKPLVLRPFDGFSPNRRNAGAVIRKAEAEAAVPFFLDNDINGVLLLGRKKSGDRFSSEEAALLETVMDKVSMLLLSNILLKEAVRSSLELGQRLKMAAMRNLARGVHHEVRNPLHALSLFSGATMEEIKSHRWDEISPEALAGKLDARLDAMLMDIARIRDSLGRFAQFARPDKQEEPFSLQLNEEIYKFLALMKDGHKLDDISVTARIPNDCLVLATPDVLQTALFNLFNNALEAMKGRGEIDLAAASEENGFVKITMRDNGPGIPQEVLPRIFDEYFTTKSDSEAAGIGLSMLKHQIEKIGGKVEAFSTPGQGAEFIVHLRKAA